MTTSTLLAMLVPGLAGLATGAGLIVAIGPQNVFVLRQGVARAHVGPVVAVCIGSDVVLILAGVAGLGAVVAAHPGAVALARILGAVYVIVLGILAIRRCMRSDAAIVTGAAAASVGRWSAVGAAVALTWLNPHVYLDTVLTMGAIANSHGNGKWAFAVGACLASLLWFVLLGVGAGRLAPVFATARAWRILDALVAAVMFAMGALLLSGL